MVLLKFLAKLLKALNSDVAPWQLALGFVFGMMMGLAPTFTWFNLIILGLLLILKANFGMAFLGFAVFGLIGYLLDPVMHSAGYWILSMESLKATFQNWYNTPWMAATRFNNTIVMGSLFVGLAGSVLVFPFMLWFVGFYREKLKPGVEKLKIVKMLKGSKLYKLYEGYSNVSGG